MTLKTGKEVVLKDTEGLAEAEVYYSFREYLKDLGYFLIHTQFFEGEGCQMIDDRTGKRDATCPSSRPIETSWLPFPRIKDRHTTLMPSESTGSARKK